MRTLEKWISPFAAALLAVAAVSCREQKTSPPPQSAAKTNTYFVKGEIKEVKTNESRLIVKHEEIPGYMMAMTMPFDVREPQVLGALQAGDKIAFRMLVTDTDGWIDQVKVLERPGQPSPPPAPPEPRFRRVREVPPLNIGDALPDYPLTNELGQAVSLGQFKGEAVGFTFIFTRCPFPNFCPRLAENFLAAHRQLAAMTNGPANWRLLSISFDPEFDTPATLKNYAARYPRDPKRWSYLTGALIEIDALTEQFGLYFSREDGSFNINHNLRTVVVDARGRVQKVFIGNEWKASEFVEEMVKAAAAK